MNKILLDNLLSVKLDNVSNYKDNKYQLINSNKLSENISYNSMEICYKNSFQDNLNVNDLERLFNSNLFLMYFLKSKELNLFKNFDKNNFIEFIDKEKISDDKQWILLSIIGLLVLVMQLFYIVL